MLIMAWKEVNSMDLIEHLLMKLVSFGGIGFLIYICSRNKYIFKYSSEKRKIEIYPKEDKSQNNQSQE